MRAGDLITDEIPTLKGSDNSLLAMQLMDEYKVKHLPVVESNELLGIISDAAILEIKDPEEPLNKHPEKLISIYINANQHVYDVVKVAAELQLSAIPIVDDDIKYLGFINIYCLVRELAKIAAISDEGSILVLELNENDYSLSEIAQIVEGNDARILSANITSVPDSTILHITLKINRSDLQGVLQTFARYDYIVSASYQKNNFEDTMQNRYDELMRYLNM